jgi:hypothetical protein
MKSFLSILKPSVAALILLAAPFSNASIISVTATFEETAASGNFRDGDDVADTFSIVTSSVRDFAFEIVSAFVSFDQSQSIGISLDLNQHLPTGTDISFVAATQGSTTLSFTFDTLFDENGGFGFTFDVDDENDYVRGTNGASGWTDFAGSTLAISYLLNGELDTAVFVFDGPANSSGIAVAQGNIQVPEPGLIGLLGLGLIALCWKRRAK